MNLPIRRIVLAAAAATVAFAGFAAAPAAGQKLHLKVSEPAMLAPGSADHQRYPAVAATGNGRFLVVWQEGYAGDGGDCNIRGAFVQDGRVAGKPFDVCRDAGVQERPAVAASADGFLVVWQDYRNGRDADVLAVRVGPDGKTLDARPIVIAGGAGTQCKPVVAGDGKGFLVAWQSTVGNAPYHVFARRLGGDGKLADADPLDLGQGHSPAVAFGGGKCLVVYEPDEGRRTAVQGALVPPAGPPGSAGDVMQTTTDAPSAAAGGKGFVVIASCRPTPSPWGWGGPGGFAAARVGFDGEAPDAAVNYEYYNKALGSRTRPNILDSSQWKGMPDKWPAGMKGGFPGTDNDRWPHVFSTVAPCAGGFVAVWVNRKIINRWQLADADLYGSAFATDPWKVADVGGAPVAVTAGNESNPKLASDGRTLLLVYESVNESGELRAAARTLTVETR